MYNEEYARQWIANHESKKDIFRTDYLEPYLKEKVTSYGDSASVLDIGCGWGLVAEFISKKQKYFGIDATKEFFPYIKQKFPDKNIILSQGLLPYDIETESPSPKISYTDLV